MGGEGGKRGPGIRGPGMPGPYGGISGRGRRGSVARGMSGAVLHALLRRARRKLQGRPRLIFEVHALLLDHKRSVLDLRVDSADVLSEDPQEKQLNRPQEENADYQRGDADREIPPKCQLIDE